jgi:extracellular factor (EF) 3-hydroxypalmitic acid methyl ester biosynthesis protein
MVTDKYDLKETLIVGQTGLGIEIRGTLLKISRLGVLFELYGPDVLQLSEVLSEFRVIVNGNTIYSGKATVRNLMNTGPVLLCEVGLDDGSWRDVEVNFTTARNGAAGKIFDQFFLEWQKIYKVLPEYKMLVADIQVFLTDLRLWLDQFELTIRGMPSGDRARSERDLIENLIGPISHSLNHYFEKFEMIASQVEEDLQPIHSLYVKRQLHPLLLCSPFMHRIFRKPLGYAGDYEMVNMILRDPHEGSSLFSKVLNRWFLSQVPAEAHRNRVKFLTQRISEESSRVLPRSGKLKVFNLGCGPAKEVVDFIEQYDVSERAEFTLLDFNEETLAYTGSVLTNAKRQFQRNTPVRIVRKSVAQLLKGSAKESDDKYDFIYCAGLFDYLQDRVCRQLTNMMYGMLAPGGLLLVTNVDTVNPIQHIMGFIFEWHLLYRTHTELESLIPSNAPPESGKVVADTTGCNIFMEVRKPL